MNKLSTLLIVIALTLVGFSGGLLAQNPAPSDITLTPEMLDKPFVDWDLNLTSILVGAMFVGRALNYARRNGGLKSILSGIWNGGIMGDNAPRT